MKIAFLFNQKPLNENNQYTRDEFIEWDNKETIDAVADALRLRGEVVMIDCNPNRIHDIVRTLTIEKPDISFNMAEGLLGESREAFIPALLEAMNLRYTASPASSMILSHNKAIAKQIFSHNHIPTPYFNIIKNEKELSFMIKQTPLRFPLIVKPVHEGSSKGIFEHSVTKDTESLVKEVSDTLIHYKQPVIIEQFLNGKEFTVGLLGNNVRLLTLPIVEICFDSLPKHSNRIYSYEAKWIWDTPDNKVEVFKCPAEISEELQATIAQIAKAGFNVLGCRDWARADIRLDEHGNPFILELNPLPGILPNPDEHSCYPMAARTAGIDFNNMICRVLDEAIIRYNI